MPTRLSAGQVRRIYHFIKANQRSHNVEKMCRVSGGDKFGSCGGRKSDSRQHGLAAG